LDPGGSRGLFGAALAICALVALIAPNVSAAEVKAKLGTFGTPNDAAAGHLRTPKGIAVNTSGNGGVAKGTVYVADASNQRIQQFSTSASGGGATFLRTWGIGVASGGAEGTATLTAGSAEVTSVVTTKRAFREGQIVTGAGIPAGTVVKTVTTGVGAASKLLLSNAATASASGVTLTAAEGAGNVLTNEKQTITVPVAATGSFALKFKTTMPTVELTTALITVGAPASGAGSVQEALEGLANIGAGNVAVTGAAGGPYTVEFKGARLSDNDVETIAVATQPTGGSLTIATTQQGATVYEICTADCIVGISSAAAGGVNNQGTNGLAVDQATGNVYGVGQSNHRVDVYSAEGAFLGAFGWGVKTGDAAAAGLDFCTTATGCQAGSASGAAAGQLSNSLNGSTPAIDPTAPGTVYVPDTNNNRVSKYSVTISGGAITAVSFLKAFGWDVANTGDPGDTAPTNQFEVCTTVCKIGLNEGGGVGQMTLPAGAAVDSTGALYVASGESGSGSCSVAKPCRVLKFKPPVAAGGAIEEFAPTQLKQTTGAANAVAPYNVAIDPTNDHVFVAKKESAGGFKVLEFDQGGAELAKSPGGSALTTTSANTLNSGLAVGTGERVYADNSVFPTGEVFVLGPVPAPGAEIQPCTELAPTTAKLNGKVTVPSPGGEGFNTTYHFEYSGDNGLSWTKAPVPDASAGQVAGTFPVSATVSGLAPNTTYRVRLLATTGQGTTSGEVTCKTKTAPPTVAGGIAEVSGASAKLTFSVNPNSLATTYHVEWGTSTAYGNRIPADFEAFVGSGGEPVQLNANLSGLASNTTYHFRLVAANSAGTTNGVDHEFITPNSAGLPDNRVAEQVSAPDKRPQGEVQCIFPCLQLKFQASSDGNSFYYPINNGLADTDAGGAHGYLASRSPAQWDATQVSAPSLISSPFDGLDSKPSAIRTFSDDLSCGVLESVNPLTADTPEASIELGVANLYRRNLDGTFTLLTPNVPTNPRVSNPTYYVAGVSPDCSRVYFQTGYNLLANPSGLYEWANGTLSDAGLLPNGTAGSAAKIGGDLVAGNRASAVNAVSVDGTRFFFSATSNQGPDNTKTAVFARKDGASVDASQTKTAVAPQGARYEIASTDGSHVFFSANYGLTSAASSGATTSNCTEPPIPGNGNEQCDLYVYDVDSGDLTDLSATTAPGNTKGAVVAGVVDVSDDGSYAYFVARGQLVPGKGSTYAQNLSSGGGNLYLAHGGALTFIAAVGPDDLDVSGGKTRILTRNGSINSWSAQATPDGQHLLFASATSITAYASGGAEEAYLYSAGSESIVCVSCRRDGKASLSGSTHPIQGLHGQSSLAYYLPRSISDDGNHVFFNSKDALAPGASEGSTNLYEWERGQVYLLLASHSEAESAGALILDSSASGDDVFVSSVAQLAPSDVDNALDVYDLRVGGGFPTPPTPPTPCDPAADQCQGGSSLAPAASDPASAGFSGPGNPPASNKPRPKGCRKGQVRRHGKCVKRNKRAASNNRGGVK
jgi:hypothetical protein